MVLHPCSLASEACSRKLESGVVSNIGPITGDIPCGVANTLGGLEPFNLDGKLTKLTGV